MSKKISLAFPIVVMELLLFIFACRAVAASSVTVSPTSVNLGSVNVGSSSQQQIKITNFTGISVTITSVALSGNYFAISGIAAPLSLSTGKSATLTVTFAPKAAGAQTGKIVVQGRGITTAINVTLSANGVSSGGTTSISAVPTGAAFGNVPVGSTNSQTFTVTNHGTSTISVSSEAVSGTGFSMSGLADSAQIAAGKSSTFNVAFKPAKTGTITGSASINFSASGKTVPLTVSLSGNGVTATGALQVSPTAINFGDVLVGHSGSLSLKVTNTGNSALTTSRGTISGSGFSMIGGLAGLTLQPGQSDSVTVVFEPAVTGSASGTISIQAGLTTTSVALSGSGTAQTSSPHSVSLSWVASTSPSVEGYYVERGTTSGGPYSILNSSPETGTSYVDATVQGGKGYFYVIVAINNGGEQSKPSQQVSATIPSP
ncbi:MAG: choice-of-anchor D domain-containing protein [Candidatus Acidiferrales bacterium]